VELVIQSSMNAYLTALCLFAFLALVFYFSISRFDLYSIAHDEGMKFTNVPENAVFISDSSDFYYGGRRLTVPVSLFLTKDCLLICERGFDMALWLPRRQCVVVRDRQPCALFIVTQKRSKRIRLDPDVEKRLIAKISI